MSDGASRREPGRVIDEPGVQVRGRVFRHFRSGLDIAYPFKVCHLTATPEAVVLRAPIWGSLTIERTEVVDVVYVDARQWTIPRPYVAFRLLDGRYISWRFGEAPDLVRILRMRGWPVVTDDRFRVSDAQFDHRFGER
jgi:hypothetical protein